MSAQLWPLSSAFFSNASMSTFCAGTLPLVDAMFNCEGVDASKPRLGLSVPLRFKRSRASNSASENSLTCFGRKGTGVDTREVKNYQQGQSRAVDNIE